MSHVSRRAVIAAAAVLLTLAPAIVRAETRGDPLPPKCVQVCAESGATCNDACFDDYTGGWGTCDSSGELPCNMCVPVYVEESRHDVATYTKSWPFYVEVWKDQIIHEYTENCSVIRLYRDRCDPYMFGHCWNVSEADCCQGFGQLCYTGQRCS